MQVVSYTSVSQVYQNDFYTPITINIPKVRGIILEGRRMTRKKITKGPLTFHDQAIHEILKSWVPLFLNLKSYIELMNKGSNKIKPFDKC